MQGRNLDKRKVAIFMLFYKDHPRACEHCAWADKTVRDTMLCYYHGPVAADHKCRKFRYDPYKRIPGRTASIKPLVLQNDDNEA